MEHVHSWPFDGWSVRPNRSVVVEVYPALWSRTFRSAGRTPDQQDALVTAEWLRRADTDGILEKFFYSKLEPHERKEVDIEGWILGVLYRPSLRLRATRWNLALTHRPGAERKQIDI
jgi:hypothetical protein